MRTRIFMALIGVACFVAGGLAMHAIPPAHAASQIIHATSAKEITNQCDFTKSMAMWNNGYLCVKR